ncbi:PH (Pleckstrin Homology) domain-containing protein [Tamaricihabitans halophyticus]|uniref:PH (Pleckstrin Homology) domain-containing protein n=1 Tax=Tamaricihabitans halophyticus TaxID=1262583 RepID=A0A4R2R375_9PSEU|nr:PH domain-containing protein [Tamaricihabitans halophyticus]TCP56129.1 PH (Pleckstrin Homology) domain-containing protein [Tamaricihabitans halophyticus]
MAYPDDLLSTNERVVIHKHPHWKALLLPVLVLLITLGGGGWLALLARDFAEPWDMISLIAIGVVALILLIWAVFAPFVRWRTTHFIVTTDRVMAREGLISRTGIDIPLARINSVRFEHGLIDRIVGCGTLIIESASEEPLEFDDIPGVEKVHSILYREINDNPYDDYHATGYQQTAQYPYDEQAPEQPYGPDDGRQR